MRYIIFCLLLTVGLTACGTRTETMVTDNSIRFRVLSHGQTSGLTQQKFLTFYNAAGFSEFWYVHSNGNLSTIPKINFETHMVIGVFLGEQRTGGFDIRIDNIIEQEKFLQVEILVTKPKPGSNRTMMITQPHMIVVLPQSKKQIEYTFRYNQ